MAEALQAPKKPQWGGLGMDLREQEESYKTGKAKYEGLPDAEKAVYKEQYVVAMKEHKTGEDCLCCRWQAKESQAQCRAARAQSW